MRALALALLLVFATTASGADATMPAPASAKKVSAAVKKRVIAKQRCLRRAKTKAARRRCVRAATKQAAPPVTAPGPASAPVTTPVGPDATTPVTAPEPAAAPVAETAPAAPACDPSPWIKATAEDAGGAFRLRLSRDCVPAGRVLFSFVNTDAQPHNVWIAGVSPAAPAQQVIADSDGGATGSADMAAGTWRVYCSITGHEAMTKTISVTAP